MAASSAPVPDTVASTARSPTPTAPGLSVIGAGFGRTGTKSLQEALLILGFPTYHMVSVFEKGTHHANLWYETAQTQKRIAAAPAKDQAAIAAQYKWDEIFDGYTAAVDWPACQFYRELMQRYPDAKVILTVRDSEKWYQSIINTVYFMQSRAIDSFWHRLFIRFSPFFFRWSRMVCACVWDTFPADDLRTPEGHRVAIQVL
jgi:hypothetical protein